jgi:hypothetical protein
MDRYPGVALDAEYRGVSRLQGDFTTAEGEKVAYGQAHKFEYEDPDGVVRELSLSEQALDKVAGFDINKVKRGDHFRLTLTVVVRDGYCLPESVVPANGRVSAAA